MLCINFFATLQTAAVTSGLFIQYVIYLVVKSYVITVHLIEVTVMVSV